MNIIIQNKANKSPNLLYAPNLWLVRTWLWFVVVLVVSSKKTKTKGREDKKIEWRKNMAPEKRGIEKK